MWTAAGASYRASCLDTSLKIAEIPLATSTIERSLKTQAVNVEDPSNFGW